MDSRRLMMSAAAGLALSGCALFRDETSPALAEPVDLIPAEQAVVPEQSPQEQQSAEGGTARPYYEAVRTSDFPAPVHQTVSPALTGRRAIAAANSAASAPSRSDRFQGGVQVFAWSSGRVFEVWTAPLRVTTLTLGAGERLVAKAAGDTVRWQIAETVSGEGAALRTHVLIKPLERGLETNLVLTTNQRVYLIDLRSGAADAFNAAVAWDDPHSASATMEAMRAPETVRVPDPVVAPVGPLDALYRVEPQGRRPRWTPTTVFNDGRRTFIAFPDDLEVDEAPALFVVAADGQAQLVNYRQAGGLFIVDRVLDRAELRLGDRRPQVVRIRRHAGGR